MNGKYGVGGEILIKAKIVEAQTKLDSGDIPNTIYVLEVPIPDDAHRFKALEEDIEEITYSDEKDSRKDVQDKTLIDDNTDWVRDVYELIEKISRVRMATDE